MSEIDLERCQAGQPDTGLWCGLWRGHGGDHTVLIPSGMPWSDALAALAEKDDKS